MTQGSRRNTQVPRDEASVEYLQTLLYDAEQMVGTAQGIAKVQAIKLCVELATEIDRSKAALVITKDELQDLTEAELVERLDDAAREMPLSHLEVFVRAWLTAQGWELVGDEGALRIARPVEG